MTGHACRGRRPFRSHELVALAALLAIAPGCGAGPNPAVAPVVSGVYRGDVARTGAFDEAGLVAFDGLRWRFRADGPVRSSPVAAGDRIYFGGSDGYAYALDRAGSLVWKTALDAAVTSSPSIEAGTVYLQTRTGDVLALAAGDGRVLWRAPTGADAPLHWGFESGDAYVSSPVVADGTLVVGAGSGSLVALEAGTGEELWRVRTEGRVRSTPAIADGTVYVGSMDGSVYAADLATGELRWRFDTHGRSLDSGDFGFDRRSIMTSVAVADGSVYVGGRDGILYAIDAASGRERWRFDHEISWVTGSPAVRDGVVYAGSSDARFVHAVDAATGEELWRTATTGPVWSAPSLAGGVLYVGDGSGALRALSADSGSVLWSYAVGGGIRSAPLPVGDMVVFSSEDGSVYAIGGSTSGSGPAGVSGQAGAGFALRRVVFWDSAYARAAWLRGHAPLRDALAGRGFEVLDEAETAALMRAAVEHGSAARTTVVFAMDHLPPELAASGAGPALLRAFLDAGGKVVWVGIPPLVWPRGLDGSLVTYDDIDREAAGALLGLDLGAANFDRWGTRITDAGRAWGLESWWTAPWGIPANGPDEVLAVDENGDAAAWVRRYGGPPGSGFVMLGWPANVEPDAAVVAALADYRPS